MSTTVLSQEEINSVAGILEDQSNNVRINTCLEQAIPETALETEPSEKWVSRALFILDCATQGVLRAAERDGLSPEDLQKIRRITQFAAAEAVKLTA